MGCPSSSLEQHEWEPEGEDYPTAREAHLLNEGELCTNAVTSAVASSGPLLTKELSGIRLEDTDLDHHAHPVRMYVADADLLTASSRAVQHPRAARSHGHDAITASGPSLPARGPPWNPDSALTRWR